LPSTYSLLQKRSSSGPLKSTTTMAAPVRQAQLQRRDTEGADLGRQAGELRCLPLAVLRLAREIRFGLGIVGWSRGSGKSPITRIRITRGTINHSAA
jgi:hypothetical protein